MKNSERDKLIDRLKHDMQRIAESSDTDELMLRISQRLRLGDYELNKHERMEIEEARMWVFAKLITLKHLQQFIRQNETLH